MNRAEELVREVFREWQPPRELSVSEWADREFWLSPEYAAEHGKWTTIPFQREPLDCFANPRVSQEVIKSSTQMLKTACLQIAAAYAITQDPGPILFLLPDGKSAADFSKERVAPMIRDTPALRHRVRDAKANKSDNTISQKWFKGGMLSIASAGTPGNLARRSIRYLLCDEEDKWPVSAGHEGDPFSLAMKRTATFRHRKKSMRCCSPTVENSAIDRAYKKSDRREFYVPCPGCGHRQSLMGWRRWNSQVRWNNDLATPEEKAATARYHCEECDVAWDDAKRWRAVDAGEWRAHAPFNGIAGFWISELYSPWKQLREIVLDFLTKKDNPIEFQTWVNTSLAENWQEPGETLEWERLIERRERYEPGTVPAGGLALVAGADVQRADGGRIEVEITAIGENRETWSVDYRVLYGNPAEKAVWDKLESVLHETFPHENGGELPIERLFVDSGDGTVTRDVYEWVQKQPRPRVWAIKGYQKLDQPVSGPKSVEGGKNAAKTRYGAILRAISVDFFKSSLYADLKKRAPTPDELASGLKFPQGYCHFPVGEQYGDEHFKQLCSEQMVNRKDRRGRAKSEYVQLRPRNEALDARVYAMAAAWDYGSHRFQAKHWDMLKQRLAESARHRREPERIAHHPPPPRRSLPVVGRISL